MWGSWKISTQQWLDGDNCKHAIDHGYAFVDIRPSVRHNREERTVSITYVINEAPRVYVEEIKIIDNVRTHDKVIRREMRLVEGDAYNS